MCRYSGVQPGNYKQTEVLNEKNRTDHINFRSITGFFRLRKFFDKYTEILDRYGFFALNGQTEDFSSEKGDQYINISGYFTDGRCIEIRKTVNEDDYKAFITEFIEMTNKYVLDRQ